MTCSNNLSQLGKGIHNYASTYQEKLPPQVMYAQNNPGWGVFYAWLLPYIEQDNVLRASFGSGASWGNGQHAAVIKTYLCPSDASHTNGRRATDPGGWAVTSYSNNYYMFAVDYFYESSTGTYTSRSRFGIGNIPDGSSNTIGILERYGWYGSYNWSPLWNHPADRAHWGITHQWSHTYGMFGQSSDPNNVNAAPRNQIGSYLPQWGYKPNPSQPLAHPYYPNSGHTATNQVLLMDGSVRGVSAGISPTTWSRAIQADDGFPLGNDW
jgi:hypothetical protein